MKWKSLLSVGLFTHDESASSMKSCFSADDIHVLKSTHVSNDSLFFDDKEFHCDISRIASVENGDFNNLQSEDLIPPKPENNQNGSITESIISKACSNPEYSSGYMTPQQKLIKQKMKLINKLKDLKQEKETTKNDIQKLEGFLEQKILLIHHQKQKTLQTITAKSSIASQKIYEMDKKRTELKSDIRVLEHRISELQEMTKLKEVKKRESYFQLYQKGRQSFQFNKKSQILYDIGTEKRRSSMSDLRFLEEVLEETKKQEEDSGKKEASDIYSNAMSQLPYDRSSIIYRASRDCYYHYLITKSKEEKKLYLRTLANVMRFDEDTLTKLLQIIK